MRELKFRVWDAITKRYVDLSTLTITYDGKLTAVTTSEIMNPVLNQKDYIVEQYTGLKDKNGKEIYEGDIITETYPASENGKYKENGEYKAKDYWVVKYDKKRAGFSPFCDCDDNGEYLYEEHTPKDHVEVEVVGNIHKNPGILEDS